MKKAIRRLDERQNSPLHGTRTENALSIVHLHHHKPGRSRDILTVPRAGTGDTVMTTTIVRTTFIAAVGALAAGLLASQARGEEGARAVVREVAARQFVDCWIGMKWGDQPGQLIRGWICERPAAKADQHTGVSASPPALTEKEDVAAIGPDGIRR
jgi:hypothetical protein